MNYSGVQLWSLTLLRVLVGWHLLYEGIAKLLNPEWSAELYLLDSRGLFDWFFHWLGSNAGVLAVVDLINIWGLILIGAALLLGLFTRAALIGGIALLSLYFLSHPPLIDTSYALPREGNYVFVDKTLIEMVAMIVLMVFPASRVIGLELLISEHSRKHLHG